MIEEVLRGAEDGGADFAVADLSITSDRATAVTFSMPWMTLGNTRKKLVGLLAHPDHTP